MMTLPEIAIKRHVTTLMIIVSLVVLGTVALVKMPLAFMPDVDEPQIWVQVDYPSATPSQVERMVIRPPGRDPGLGQGSADHVVQLRRGRRQGHAPL